MVMSKPIIFYHVFLVCLFFDWQHDITKGSHGSFMWKEPLVVMNPQMIITRLCGSSQLYEAFLEFFGLLFWFSGLQLYWYQSHSYHSVVFHEKSSKNKSHHTLLAQHQMADRQQRNHLKKMWALQVSAKHGYIIFVHFTHSISKFLKGCDKTKPLVGLW